jgi:hypothetical protein
MSLLLIASVAHADSAPRYHDGFQLQLAGGFGYYGSSADYAGTEMSMGGMTKSTQLLMGGTIGSLVIGGGLVFDHAGSPTFEQNGMEVATTDVSQMVVALGAYADYYLDPQKGGWHVQGFAGWGGLETSSSGNVGGSDPTGLVAFAGGGYQWWLTSQLSGGVMGRILYAPLSSNDVSFPTWEPSILGTITWH